MMLPEHVHLAITLNRASGGKSVNAKFHVTDRDRDRDRPQPSMPRLAWLDRPFPPSLKDISRAYRRKSHA